MGHITKKKQYDLKIWHCIQILYSGCPCVYACGLESLCTEKDVSSPVHSMKEWFSVPVGVDLYLSPLCLQCLAALSTHL